MTIRDFLDHYVVRGACTCGQCADAVLYPENHQPEGHTADVIFFKVALDSTHRGADLRALIEREYPVLLDGCEHNYLEIGALLGDQGEALLLMGAGSLLGVWTLMTPRSLFSDMGLHDVGLSDKMLMKLAVSGMVKIQTKKEDGTCKNK